MSMLRPITVPLTWSPAFARTLDGHLRDVAEVLNGGVRLGDQFAHVKTGVRWNTDVGTLRVGPFQRTVRWVIVLAARQVGATSTAISCPTVSWSMDGGDVVISAVGTLASSTDYTLDILCLEG